MALRGHSRSVHWQQSQVHQGESVPAALPLNRVFPADRVCCHPKGCYCGYSLQLSKALELLLANVSEACGRCQADSTLAHLCSETGDMLQCSASVSEVDASASSSCHRGGFLPCLLPCFLPEPAAIGLSCCSVAVAAGACTPLGCRLGSVRGCCWAPCCCSSCCRADSGDCMSLPSTTGTGFECRVRSSTVRCVLPFGASSNPPSCLGTRRDHLLPASNTFHGSRDLPR